MDFAKEEYLYVDDELKNLEAGKKSGIGGWLFSD